MTPCFDRRLSFLHASAVRAGALVLFAALGCGPSQTGPSSPESAASSDVPFDQLSPAEKKQFMQSVIVPAMSKVLKASPEAEHFERVGCVTCHGAGAKSGSFEMPSPDLPKFASFEQAEKEHPEMAHYMAEKVEPEMAKLLKVDPYDPKTGKGFGCFECHVKSE